MKKAFIGTTLIIFFAITLFAQSPTETSIIWGNPIKLGKRSSLSDIVAYDSDGFYSIQKGYRVYGIGILSVTKTIITLEHYGNDMNLRRSSELELIYDDNDMDYERIIQMNDVLLVFGSYKNKSTKKNMLFVQSINKNTLKPNGDFKKVGEVDYEGNRKSNSGDFNVKLSRDTSKLMVYYNLPYEQHENEKFGFHVLDSKLNFIWEKEVSLPYEDGLFGVEDFKVDNKGNVHVLGVVFNEVRKEKRKGEPNYQYEILSYFKEGDKMRSYPVKIDGKFLTDMQITVTDELDLLCGGFYSNVGSYGLLGTYFITIDGQTKQIKTQSFKEFGLDFITQHLSERKEERAKKRADKGKDVELYQYDLNDLVTRSDGGALLIAEQYYVRAVTTTMTNPNGGVTMQTNYYYYYNDIIVINISPLGEIEWTQKIQKKQVTINDGGFFSSYALAIIKDKICLLFNDNAANTDNTSQKIVPYNRMNSTVFLVEIDGEGNVKKQSLFDARTMKVITRPKVCEQVSQNELILFAQKRKKQQFAKITFE